MKKRVLSWILAVLMLASLFPTSAFAEDAAAEGVSLSEAADIPTETDTIEIPQEEPTEPVGADTLGGPENPEEPEIGEEPEIVAE